MIIPLSGSYNLFLSLKPFSIAACRGGEVRLLLAPLVEEPLSLATDADAARAEFPSGRLTLTPGTDSLSVRWQTAGRPVTKAFVLGGHYGDLSFDSARFPDPRGPVEHLHRLGFKVTAWVIPFVDPEAAAFAEGGAKGFLVRGPGRRARDGHLPPGRWRDHWSGDVFDGGAVLKAVAVPLARLPLFHRA